MKKFALVLITIVITLCMAACSPDEIAEKADLAAAELEEDLSGAASKLESKINDSDDAEETADITVVETTVATTSEPTAASNTEPATVPTTAPVDELVNGMHPDFKEAMDAYEEFMDEYVEFMSKYQESDDVLSMALEYAKFLGKYADATAKFEKWEDDDLNDTELQYYIQVQTRVNQKLLTVAAAMPG